MKKPNNEWGNFIPSSGINESIANWHKEVPDRVQTCASPSTLMECPRVVWLKKQKVAKTNEPGWGMKQRFLLGRITENTIANQLKEDGKLLWHWQDDYAGQSKKFTLGDGLTRLEGTPDMLLKLRKVVISDSKTSRSDSYKWVPTDVAEIWLDPYWYKFKLQLTAYYILCHKNKDWFEKRSLPLPEECHLFSYSLDDGIVRREIAWTPTKLDVNKVLELTKRWNSAYASEEMPDCVCVDEDQVKFCPYGIKEAGNKICNECCKEA